MRLALLLLLIVTGSACTGDDDSTLLPIDGPGDGIIATDGPRTDAPRADAGAEGCGPGQLHVIPCCGGALPACLDVLDGGMCPLGSELGSCWSAGGGPTYGCVETCTPPPPYCAPAGAICQDECGGGGYLDGDDCRCACA